jgi:NTP pyrophosphatase (non-canonical NTP hydrolase)
MILAVEVYVVDLEEMKREIEALVVAKGFYNSLEDVPKKFLFAFVELGEAADAWKKGLSEEEVAEELVDVIFYVLDASRLACPSVNMDEMFRKKLEKNKKRPYQYGEGHRQAGTE